MSISLKKGQKISLSKDGSGLERVIIGLGWDEAPRKKSGFFATKSKPIDCDASAILLQNGKLVDKGDIVYFGNLIHKTGKVEHLGDNLTGAGDGDDEQIRVDLLHMPIEYDRMVIVVNIYQAIQRQQHFGMIENAFIRLVDEKSGKEICKYDLSESYPDCMAMIFGEVYRHNDEWKFNAIGQGTTDPSLGELSGRFL